MNSVRRGLIRANNTGSNQSFGQEKEASSHFRKASKSQKEFFCEGFLNEDFQREVLSSRFFLFLSLKN
jgi:hypothetical protein